MAGEANEVPDLATKVISALAEQAIEVQGRIRQFERDLLASYRSNGLAPRIATVPGLGLLGAGSGYRHGSHRQFAAWLGFTPLNNSSGGGNASGSPRGRPVPSKIAGHRHDLARQTQQASSPNSADPCINALLARKPLSSGRRIVTLSGHSPPPPSNALIAREREDAHALARCGVDRVGDRRPDRRHTRLADPCRPLGAWNHVDFHLRHFVEAQHVVTVEIALLDSAARDGDLRLHDGTEAEADPAFHLGPDDVWVDRHSAIDGADDALDLRLSPVIDGYLGDLRHVGLEQLGDRNAAESALGQRPVPTGFFGREPQHARMPRMVLQEFEPERDRVPASSLTFALVLSCPRRRWF